jgi:GMP synthase (glutamine-hydrolysing)
MHVHFIIHENFEAPGAIESWAKAKGHSISYSRVYQNEALPQDASMIDFLVIMGGPQSPDTTLEECPHFNSAKEMALIFDAIARDKLVLGVCLGAQLIGEALGAKFEHSPHREIGVFPIHLTEQGKTDSIFSQFPEQFLVGHWHGDMPGLTKDSVVLAYSKGCPRQVVRYSKKVYGFQCHFEFTPSSVAGMIESCSQDLNEAGKKPYIQNSDQLLAHRYDEINQFLYQFLDEFSRQKL